jgi:uncharacterized protein
MTSTVAEAPPPPVVTARPASLWSNHDFLKFWSGETFSLFGVRVDRARRKRVMMIANGARMLLIAAIPILSATHHLTLGASRGAGLSSAQIGLVFACSSVGGLAGAAVSRRLITRFRLGAVYAVSMSGVRHGAVRRRLARRPGRRLRQRRRGPADRAARRGDRFGGDDAPGAALAGQPAAGDARLGKVSENMYVKELWRYPVKSMRGETLHRLVIDAHGAVGDRYFALKDSEGRLGSGKTTKRFRQIDGLLGFTAATEDGDVVIRFPDGRIMRADDPAIAPTLTAACGVDLKVESEDQDRIMYRDSAPLHLLTEASIAWLRARLPDVAIDARRFRPNIVIAGAATGLAEQEWLGRDIAIGDAVIVRAARSTVRCVMTTQPQAELGAAPEVLRKLAADNAASLGIYAEVLKPGTVRVGDALRLV